MRRLLSIVIGAAIVLALVSSSMFVVDQNRYAVVYALGELREVIKEPGLHFKLPPPFQNVVYLDKRLQTLDTADGERFVTAEKKDLLVDAFVKWRINDPRQYLMAIGGSGGQGSADRGAERVAQAVQLAMNAEIGARKVADVLSGQRQQLAAGVRERVAAASRQLGVEIVDVRVKRVDFTAQVNNAVIERMKAERLRVASETRSTGEAEAEGIRADAERQRSVILAEGFRDAETIKGEGDAKAAQIYAQSFGKNPEFYRFYRSLEAYRATFKSRSDVLVLDSNSDFFKYFKSPGTGK
ncbi:membrane protein [Massilia sp. WF1]|uniref:protease modulator HflC n=1 Tax=unclassified Massilia TaxID=2609279 RepID=UPI00064A3441|nr:MULTISPECIES: protease modulator HflC [unclassified Massilia]ALK98200.1 protease modulator HflC [Massilia sp. WG5]KLU37226.1 membrane protein [Massilia sp. WF1]